MTELTVEGRRWTNGSEQKVERPENGAEGEPARRKQKIRGTPWDLLLQS